MMKKKFIDTIAALMLSMMCSLPVMAVTEGYNWTFYSDGPNDSLPAAPGKNILPLSIRMICMT